MYLGSVSRLVIDLNRSLSHPHVFSKWSAGLSDLKRARLIDQYYQPYRDAIEQHIRTQRAAQTVVHLSIHSFTPVLQRQRREVEVGLLFDPARSGERKLAHQLHLDLQRVAPAQGLWRVRANRPYRGTSDGLTTYLRTCFSAHHYVGIEIELNQKLLKERLGDTARRVCLALAALA
jgi:predicted N-formylglutamate amidohydrolase